jgi:hypothetical protein
MTRDFHEIDSKVLGALANHVQNLLGYGNRYAVGAQLDREKIADFLAETISKELTDLSIGTGSEWATNVVEQLVKCGISDSKQIIDKEKSAQAARYFESLQCYNGHIIRKSDGIRRRMGDGAEDFQYGCFELSEVALAPHLWETVLDDDVLAVAANYLKCTPTLYSVHAFQNFPELPDAKDVVPYKNVQTFHRDRDDFKFISLFINLTDSDADHYYIPGSHTEAGTIELFKLLLSRSDQLKESWESQKIHHSIMFRNHEIAQTACENLLQDRTMSRPSVAGHGFFTDVFGLHKGGVPTRPRLLLTARFGLYSNSAASKESRPPIAFGALRDRITDSELIRYVCRSIIDFS